MAALLCVAGLACSEPAEVEEPWTQFELRGKVVDLRPGEPAVAVIEHEEIEGFMKAMTMGFPVRDQAEFEKLSDGDVIEAVVQARGYAEYYIEDIQVVDAGEPADSAAPE